MDWLKNFDLERWWNAVIVVGLAVLVAGVAAKDRAIVLIGLGMIAAGFGEWLNHGKQMEFMGAGMLTSFPRQNRVAGLLLLTLGILLMAFGLYRLLTA